ncbi:nuclear transport factor 2 family protein [Halogeometricum luteum]|uniref:Nuclear transport factor 2 family protein n=1 Tax=Halogeometricum luteum TaxID=2950537 RepID=A0ABU2G1R5_9EURY|nr:nuclear transport factor 2 family protein [Halogeometricum sp. S3BR5-2]MDS0294730.1 nuclear transport factor 2 family protein [Halogeometricum sp. S3BR5-2]
MSARATVEDYYEALRRGEPLYPYFAESESVTKFGVGETLVGYDAVAEGLREQTRTTTDWTVESGDLRVVERDDHAAFADDVRMAWTDTEAGEDRSFETRWSGTLERRPTDDDPDADPETDEWVFLGMHVSVAHDTEDG